MIDLIDSSADEELHFRPSPDSWNILECVEHICLVNGNISRILQIPPPPVTGNLQPELHSEGKLNHILVTKRDIKRTAPDSVTPKGIYKTADEAKSVIYDDAERILYELDQTDISTHTHTIPHHALGEMTKTDWVHFMLAHTQRHLHQIEQIKENYKQQKNS